MEQELNQTETSIETKTDVLVADPFSDESWVSKPPVSEVKADETNAAPIDVITKPEEKAAVDAPLPDSELKTNLGFDTWDDAKKQFEELKTLKETASTKEEIKFANEQSKKLFDLLKEGKEDDVYAVLAEKKKLDKLIAADVNEKTAPEIIKAALQQKYKGLSDDLIDYKFNKQFGTPKEPVQRVSETDDEFEERQAAWKEDVAKLKNELLFEAQTLKPELEKLKSELVLPDIQPKESQTQQPTQEELDNYAKVKDAYFKSADAVIKELNELSITVKDEDVDVPLSYAYSVEEKKLVASQMQELAEKDFNVTYIFDKRWSNKDGSINTTQIAKDLALLNSGDKAIQKLSNDAASKIKLKYIQEKTNIQLNGNSSGTFSPQNGKSEEEKMYETIWNA
jgi:hypothetical protein